MVSPVRQTALSVLCFLAACTGPWVRVPPPPEPPRPALTGDVLDARARAVAEAIGPAPRWAPDLFGASFRANVSDDALRQLFAGVSAAEGEVREVRRVRLAPPEGARYELVLSRGGVQHFDLRLEPEPPHAVRYLWIFPSVPGFPDLAAAEAAFAALPGRFSLCVTRLDPDGPRRLAAVNPDTPMDVASAAKLYVLGALCADIRVGGRSWWDTVPLCADRRSIPSGLLHRWPDGSPVTLHTLATMMIGQSDNTATDTLLARLGRERVERMQEEMGHMETELNVPFLLTGEVFRLKYAGGGARATEYLALPPEGRRWFLDGTVSRIPIGEIDTPAEAAPRFVDTIGWFASTADLCRAMDWLRRTAEDGGDRSALEILAVEPGTSDPPDLFPYQGYKGGRMPGIANGTWLLRNAGGTWYAVAATWNDTGTDVDYPRFRRMMTRVLMLLAEED